MHLLLIRHADPDYEKHTLTPQGFREAEALGRRMATAGVTAVHSSTSPRARLTARAVAEPLGLPVTEHPWLLEPPLRIQQNGVSYTIWDLFGETVRAGDRPPTQEDWSRLPDLDSEEVRAAWTGFRASADEFIAGLGYRREGGRYRIERRNRDRIAAVCHNGTILLFIAHLLEIPLPLAWCGFYAWPSSVSTFFFEEQSEEWAVPRALAIADTSHLYAAGLEPQPRAMGAGRFEPYVK
jgi:broad specificity phosphatase PhoE